MTREELNQKDYVVVEIFKGKKGNFNVTLRWSAQDKFTSDIMATDVYNDMPGVDVVRSCIDHTLRIKLQSYVKDLAYELTDCKKYNATKGTGTQYDQVIAKVHEQQLVEDIKDKAIDFCYGTTYIADKEAKKIESVDKSIESMLKSNPEALMKMLEDKGLV